MKRILLGITGGISAYKCAELVRLLGEKNFEVKVILTESAKQFITPITLQALSGFPVYDSLWDQSIDNAMRHIELAKWADIILIAPATANCIAKLAQGFANDLLSTVCLASQAPIMIAPAMNQAMWHHPATQGNLQILSERNVTLLEPASGLQACGDEGVGRMQEPEAIVEALQSFFSSSQELKNITITITAGPTQEALDPVRYLSNHSSGKMGYAIAEVAQSMGAKVFLISGPTVLNGPKGVTRIDVLSAKEMQEAAMQYTKESDVFIGSAAIADYRPEIFQEQKIKKNEDVIMFRLIKNPDILAEIALLKNTHHKKLLVVGFCAETENLLTNAREKKARKNVDIMIANPVNEKDCGFHNETNKGWLITQNKTIELSMMPKKQMARLILEEVIKTLTVR